tara:strand:- start:2453 stop:3082 length:630 start_codon:yes stop_codon:yes gene_type:complete
LLGNKNKFSIKTKFPIILASGSSIRKKILMQTGLKFKTVSSNLNESLIKKKLQGKNFSYICKKLSEEKALVVSKKFNNAYVIGSDQICIFERKLLDKPSTKEKAINQLVMLSGNEHSQISASSICFNGKIIYSFFEKSCLKMRTLSKNQIIDYINFDMPLNSCGSYKYESKGYLLFSKVRGNQFAIQGIPLFSLLNNMLKENIISYEKS